MRINKYVALSSGLSRRRADELINDGKVQVNGALASAGQNIIESDEVTVGSTKLVIPVIKTIMLNKPRGYVVSRERQGNSTIYELLPNELYNLKPVGRLDKNTSGLILLSNNGQLAQALTHPKYDKTKVYKATLNKPLSDKDHASIEKGIALEDGRSSFRLNGESRSWTIYLTEGRNRQIRRTFEALSYKVMGLHRTEFGPFKLNNLSSGQYVLVGTDDIL